jgi:hypothetical protein
MQSLDRLRPNGLRMGSLGVAVHEHGFRGLFVVIVSPSNDRTTSQRRSILVIGFALRQPRNLCPVPPYQRFFLGAAPAYDLPFETQCLDAGWTFLAPNQFNRQPDRGVAATSPRHMFTDTFIQIIGVAGVVGAIGTPQQINPERPYCSGMGLLSLRLSQPLAMR